MGCESSRKLAGRGKEIHLTSILRLSVFDFSARYHHVHDQTML